MDNKLSAPSRTMHWVDRNKIKPNDYNPNKVSRQNLELLTQSIFTNGWTLPIVVRPDGTIIDGFHRWTVAGPDWKYVPPSEEDDRRTLYERLEGKVLVVTLVITFQYAKHKGLEGIREQVYQLILKAEHMYKESGTGQQKLKWVVQQARGLLPKWLQVIMSEDALLKIIDVWFCGVKDLLDDGKINGSQKEGA